MSGDHPGTEGSIGPFPHQYADPHVYARDIHSGAGNCVCGRHLGDNRHTEAAPGVPVPTGLRHHPRSVAHRARPVLIVAPDRSTAADVAHVHSLTSWTHVGDLDAYRLRGITPATVRVYVDETASGMWNWPQLHNALLAAGFGPDHRDGQ